MDLEKAVLVKELLMKAEGTLPVGKPGYEARQVLVRRGGKAFKSTRFFKAGEAQSPAQSPAQAQPAGALAQAKKILAEIDAVSPEEDAAQDGLSAAIKFIGGKMTTEHIQNWKKWSRKALIGSVPEPAAPHNKGLNEEVRRLAAQIDTSSPEGEQCYNGLSGLTHIYGKDLNWDVLNEWMEWADEEYEGNFQDEAGLL